MISLALFKKELKSNLGLLIIFMGVLSLYGGMIVAMFDPKMGESLAEMMESMPQMFAAFGMDMQATTLMDFIINYLYGFLLVVFPAVFSIILANRLVVKYVEDGSMAYLLTTPHKRFKIIMTQAMFLICCLLFLIAYNTVFILCMSEIMFPGELDILSFVWLNLGLLRLHFFLAATCFMPSCIFCEYKKSATIGTGVLVYSVLVQMISQVGDKLESLKYATPLTLFQPQKLVSLENEAVLTLGVLGVLGTLLFGIGIYTFCKKDMSL